MHHMCIIEIVLHIYNRVLCQFRYIRRWSLIIDNLWSTGSVRPSPPLPPAWWIPSHADRAGNGFLPGAIGEAPDLFGAVKMRPLKDVGGLHDCTSSLVGMGMAWAGRQQTVFTADPGWASIHFPYCWNQQRPWSSQYPSRSHGEYLTQLDPGIWSNCSSVGDRGVVMASTGCRGVVRGHAIF